MEFKLKWIGWRRIIVMLGTACVFVTIMLDVKNLIVGWCTELFVCLYVPKVGCYSLIMLNLLVIIRNDN